LKWRFIGNRSKARASVLDALAFSLMPSRVACSEWRRLDASCRR
jgi:hypothetical protein